jgi:hypothetical protein
MPMNDANRSIKPPSAQSALEKCRQHATLIAFNRQPSRYLHASWRPEFVDADASACLFDAGYAHTALSEYIRRKTALTDIPASAIDEPAVRIGMLLSVEQLRELACRLGAILIGQPIRRVVSNAAVAAWIGALGEPLYRFACKHAPLLGGAQFIAQATPESTLLRVDTAAEQLAIAGFRFLCACSHRIDAATGQRIRLKLPRDYAQAQAAHYIHPTSETWTWIYRVWNSMPTHALPSITPAPAAYK